MGTQTTFWRKPYLLYYWLPPILWGLTVLVMSGNLGSAQNTWGLLKWLTSWFVAFIPVELNTINFYLRKIGHATAYGLMFFLWFRAFYVHADFGPRPSLFCSLGMCLFLACMDEGHQWLFSSRTGSTWDVLLDLSGSILAALITFAVWISRDYVGSRPMVSFWRRPHLLAYWLPPLLLTLAMLVMARGVIPVDSTMGALEWFLSWFATVGLVQLKILNLYLWKIGWFLAYGILYVLWFRALQRHAGASLGGAFLLAMCLCVLLFTVALSRQGHVGIWAAINWDNLPGLSGSCLAALITFAVMTPRNLVIHGSKRSRAKSWTASEPGKGKKNQPGIPTSWWRKPHLLAYWLPPLLWGLAMLIMASGVIPVSSTVGALKWFVSWFAVVNVFQLKTLNLYLWKTAKVLSGGILYVLWFRAFRAHAGYGPWRSCLCALGFCLLFSSLDEGRQWLFPARGPSIRDVILDLSGSSLAALLTFAVWKPRTGAVPLLTGQHPAGSE